MRSFKHNADAADQENRRSPNNNGMTLVEVLVGTTIFGILAGMICFIANFSLRMQTETERWNEQTDRQTTYLAQNRYGDESKFNALGTNYKFVLDTGDATPVDITDSDNVTLLQVETQREYNAEGNELPTYEDANIWFFRVD